VRERGLVSLELQFGHDEFVSYTDYRKTELTRKSADWINRASRALRLSTCGTISSATLSDLREKTLAKYNCEDSKSKVLTFADSSSFLGIAALAFLVLLISYPLIGILLILLVLGFLALPLIGILLILLVLGFLALCVRWYTNKKKLTALVTL
jgi:type IV secretory pathway VirB6-like protein